MLHNREWSSTLTPACALKVVYFFNKIFSSEMLDGTCFQALDLVKYLFINVNKCSIVELVLHMYYKSQKLNFQRPNDP